jgi:hypothetical protein
MKNDNSARKMVMAYSKVTSQNSLEEIQKAESSVWIVSLRSENLQHTKRERILFDCDVCRHVFSQVTSRVCAIELAVVGLVKFKSKLFPCFGLGLKNHCICRSEDIAPHILSCFIAYCSSIIERCAVHRKINSSCLKTPFT